MKIRIYLALITLLLVSCDSALEQYYKLPDWLKGNAREVLEDKGNFKLFLEAVDKTSYKELVNGKGVVTVMAPTDEAFRQYLSSNGYATIDDIPMEKLEKLVAYHLVYYAFSKSMFEDYKPNGIDSENDLPGVYYKFRTKSRDAISEWNDLTANNAKRKVMHKDRFLPVFSPLLFSSFQIDAKSNYEYFYPSSVWTGTEGFNISNASVIDYAIVTDNGYVYTINQVLEPLETVYNTLKNTTGYGEFLKAYDRFVSYDFDAISTTEYGKGDSLYVRSHGVALPAIASEWTNTNAGTDYTQLSALSRKAYNLFAPDDASLKQFFDTYWASGYSSLDQVNFLPLLTLLSNHVYSGDILFPEIIEKNQLISTMGTPITFNRNDAQVKKICVNGTFYGLNKILVPPMFLRVTAPAYQFPEYNIFLDMMYYADFVDPLLSVDNQFSVFYPNDDIMQKNSTLEGRRIEYVNTNKLKFGMQSLQIEGDLGLEPMKINQKRLIAGSHIATKRIFQRNDTAVYATMNAFNYLYTIGNKVYSSSLFNIMDANKVPTFSLISNYSNGSAFKLDGESASALIPETSQLKNILTSVASPAEYEYFKALVGAASIDRTIPPYNFLLGERFIVLIPTKEVFLAGFSAGKVPFSPATKVAEFLKPYFINVSESGLLDYPFPGSGLNKEIVSFGTNSKGETVKFTIIDKGNKLVIKDVKGNEINVKSILPRVYADGAAYLIDGLLSVE